MIHFYHVAGCLNNIALTHYEITFSVVVSINFYDTHIYVVNHLEKLLKN